MSGRKIARNPSRSNVSDTLAVQCIFHLGEAFFKDALLLATPYIFPPSSVQYACGVRVNVYLD